MNERIRELMLEAGFANYGEDMGSYDIPVPAFNSRMVWFAELIVRECCLVIDGHYEPVYDGRLLLQHFGVES